MDTHLLGSLHQLHVCLNELTEKLRALHEDVREIRRAGVGIAVDFGLVMADEEEADTEDGEDETIDDGEEESEESVDSAHTWP